MIKPFAARLPGALIGFTLLCTGTAFAGDHQVQISKPADPQGQVEIDNVSGSVEVVGWDKSEIDGSARLVIHVPQRSQVRVSEVSADLKTHDLSGEQRLRTVSGDIDATLAQGGSINTVSGTVSANTNGTSGALEIESVSGGVRVNGSIPELRIHTVSGDASARLASVNNVRLKTISGQLDFSGTLAAAAHLEGESVSGDLTVTFGATPGADFDVESHTGEIANCFGPAPQTSRYGPGSHLVFRNQDGTAHVRLSSLSGEIKICDHPR